MDFGIENKRALVTGASQGIGKAIALGLAKEGCNVSVLARRKNELEKVVEEMGGNEKGHDYFVADLMEEEKPTKAAKFLYEKNGNYDILIHNLGGTLEIRHPLSPAKDYSNVWKLNAGIAIEINNFFIPKMQEKHWGRIIHLSSLAAEHVRGCAAYGPAKAYLNAYTKMIGKHFVKEGIIISALLPSAVYAKGGHWDEETYSGEEKEKFLIKKVDMIRHYCPSGKMATAEEVANFAVFMASEQATLGAATLLPIGTPEILGF